NNYISYYNKQFTPKKADQEIQKMLDDPENKLKSANAIFTLLEKEYPGYVNNNTGNSKLVTDLSKMVAEQQSWLAKYFSKNKLARKSMFYNKITWFGIPLN